MERPGDNAHISGSMSPVDLSRQLDELKSSTQHAIRNSWEECERLYEVNAASETRIQGLEQKLEKLLHVSSAQEENDRRRSKSLDGRTKKTELDTNTTHAELMVAWGDDSSTNSCSSLEEQSVSQNPSRRQRRGRLRQLSGKGSSCSRVSKDDSRTVLTATSSSMSTLSSSSFDRRSMMRRVSSLRLRKVRERTVLEDELMDQMAEMQRQHQKEIEESELKLQQREDAIKTLEKALILQSETVDALRIELEEARGVASDSRNSEQAHRIGRRSSQKRSAVSSKMKRGWGSTSY